MRLRNEQQIRVMLTHAIEANSQRRTRAVRQIHADCFRKIARKIFPQVRPFGDLQRYMRSVNKALALIINK